ncbi:hypothetical protein AN1V17_32080 [Vallitalea sediminicola]
MGQTKYNLNALSEKENDIKEVNKRVDYIFDRFKIIKNSVDTDIIKRDNISNQFNSLVSDFQNIIESTYNSSQIINKAITEYSDGEQQIQNLLNGLLDINNNSCSTDTTEMKHSEASISGGSILQNWFERLYTQLISKVTHIKKFFEDSGVCINNKDYSKTVVEDESALESDVLDESVIGTYSKSESERIFRKVSEKEEYFYDEERIKKLQQYIREKGLNIEVTGQLDRATFQALQMIGIDELKENGFIKEDSYLGKGINLYTYIKNKSIIHVNFSGYCSGMNKDLNNMYFTNPPIPDSNASIIDVKAEIYTFSYLNEYFNNKSTYFDRKLMDETVLYENYNTHIVNGFISALNTANLAYDVTNINSINNYSGIRDFVFGKYAEYTSNSDVKSFNAFMEWTGVAINPSMLLFKVTMDEIKDPFTDSKNIKNRCFNAAIEDNPYNLFLIKADGYRKQFINDKYNIMKEINEQVGSKLSNDEKYFYYKVYEQISNVIDMNDAYDRNINKLDNMHEIIKANYYKEKTEKEQKEFELFYKLYIDNGGIA